MIRQAIQSAYKKSVGALKDWLVGTVSSATRGGGLIQLLYVIVIIGLMAGFVSAITYPVANETLIPYPSGSNETVPEAVVDAMVIVMGGAGIYLTYMSGRQTVRSRAVNFYLGIALLLLIVSLFIGFNLAILKGFG
ncbi:MAG: hypothetical protein JRM91_01245 [Nitrososphaerota archaeon]|jgi:hypothetical protein|nr:hypothetical protein [Nitrososphaerota archaeon]MDG6949020.1 hypothetical protein [Nitrososphaerota archaeon]